jgi:integrase
MLRLAYERRKLLRLPVIRKLKEAAPRQGFFEQDQYCAVRAQLPEDLQCAVGIAYTFGWRMQSEVLALRWSQVDLKAGTLRLNARETKNEAGRVVWLTPELHTALAGQQQRVRALERTMHAIVLTCSLTCAAATRVPRTDTSARFAVRHDGTPDVRGSPLARRRACLAGCGTISGGRPSATWSRRACPSAWLTITGHQTRSVFDRYHIVSSADLQEASRKLSDATSVKARV